MLIFEQSFISQQRPWEISQPIKSSYFTAKYEMKFKSPFVGILLELWTNSNKSMLAFGSGWDTNADLRGQSPGFVWPIHHHPSPRYTPTPVNKRFSSKHNWKCDIVVWESNVRLVRHNVVCERALLNILVFGLIQNQKSTIQNVFACFSASFQRARRSKCVWISSFQQQRDWLLRECLLNI